MGLTWPEKGQTAQRKRAIVRRSRALGERRMPGQRAVSRRHLKRLDRLLFLRLLITTEAHNVLHQQLRLLQGTEVAAPLRRRQQLALAVGQVLGEIAVRA